MSALRWTGVAIVTATVILAIALASRFGGDPGLVDSPLLGQPAPGFQLESLDGLTVIDLDDLAGEIVVINFFASWCLECRNEHAHLVATSDSFANRGVTFVQISYQEDPPQSLAYLEEAGRSDASHYLADPGSRTAIGYGVFGIPETFFIDPNGIVVGKIIGEADALVLGATIDAIANGDTPGQQITGNTQPPPDA